MHKSVLSVLIAISVIGVLGIPLGDPKFIAEALALEASYITLAILAVKKVRHTLIPNIIIAGIVIAGNTISKTHQHNAYIESDLQCNHTNSRRVHIAGVAYSYKYFDIQEHEASYHKRCTQLTIWIAILEHVIDINVK